MAIASGACKKALGGNQRLKEVLVKIDRVTKQFDEILAADTVSLTINKGEIFALLGDFSSGKSTPLHTLAGFERLIEGRIFLDGQDTTDLPPYEQLINMMFQPYALFPHMSVAQDITSNLKQDGLSKAEIDEHVVEMLKLVRMTRHAKHKSHRLSDGQRQRMALTRSLAKQPKLLLLDEPMSALDKKLHSQMQLEPVEIIERVDVTCVMATHDQEKVMAMTQRIVVMHLGCIEQIDSPMDIYETPVSRLVRRFISNVDLFNDVLVEDIQNHAVIACPQLENPIYTGHDINTHAEDKRITYALRPEKVMISVQKLDNLGHAGYDQAQGTVCDIVYLDDHSAYCIKLASGMIVQAFMANAERHITRPT